MKDKVKNALYGAIVGDALGVPVEFMDREEIKAAPVTDMRGYGTYNLPKGSWSDDSSMTLCLAESIGRLGNIDYDDIMRNFGEWFKNAKFTPDNSVFDIGFACSSAIENYWNGNAPLDCGLNAERNNGNGSLMRISPLPFYLAKKFGEGGAAVLNGEAFEIIHNVSRLTHAHPISLIGCDIYCALMLEILAGATKEDAVKNAMRAVQSYAQGAPLFEQALQKYKRIELVDFADIPQDQIKSSGYVVDTLEAAIWCFLNSDNYRDCVLQAVNLGSDTDTVACVAGSVAGLYFADIPSEWISALRNKAFVDDVVEKFCACVCE